MTASTAVPSHVTPEAIAALPKVVLHDHLDGGLRPATLIELAGRAAHPLPADEPEALGRWFVTAASSGSLEQYLSTFEHTLAVLQTADDLRRVARESVIDLAADGVVYAEQRYAPELHVRGGLTPQQVVDAVQEGIAEGVTEAALAGRTIRVGQVLAAMRDRHHSEDVAELALANRHRGVVGFDLAGPEAGFPAGKHKRALRTLRRASFPVTIHAGEADGVDSIADALHTGGALRLGHGLRVVDDIRFGEPTAEDPYGLDEAVLGDLAHWVRDQQVPLELCPTSNLQTGAARSVAQHPATALARLGFAVTINTDNRLVSGTSMTRELQLLVDEAGWTLDDLRDAALTAAWNGFIHHDERQALVDDTILPGYTVQANGRHRA
ncbi:adenosine deaminase [Actinotalea subterranea]|uniref:adenosine deaminase n=1 Tax=Actinotalea subterranea TaxID=2607497 RepID=UPI0011F03A21|nr:adenosine deaminase [Actinotalea subterranea]